MIYGVGLSLFYMFLKEVKHVVVFQNISFVLTETIMSQDYYWNIRNLIF